jgi:hypothetical protein
MNDVQCACPAADARLCIAIRYNCDLEDVERDEEYPCCCHSREEDDDTEEWQQFVREIGTAIHQLRVDMGWTV